MEGKAAVAAAVTAVAAGLLPENSDSVALSVKQWQRSGAYRMRCSVDTRPVLDSKSPEYIF